MTIERDYPDHQEVIECNGTYAIIWYKGAYFIGRLNDVEYIRGQRYLTLKVAEKVYNQLLEE